MGEISLSIIIPTYNRASFLESVVTSVKNQTYPSQGYEILIVDNASKDNTRSKALEFIQEDPPAINYFYEPQLGISSARNCGANAARGDIIVYIDDDAIAEPGWLAALANVFSTNPKVVCAGGKIDLWWENERPGWFGAELEGYLGGNRHLGEKERELPPGLYPFGGNLAIRKKAFLAVPGGFDSRFGHSGKRLGAHDETRMVDHLRGMGKIIYSPEACIRHFTPAERATRRYLAQRAFHIGQADAELDQQRQERSRFGLMRSSLANTIFLIGDLGSMILHQLLGHKKESSFELVTASSRFGRLVRTFHLFWKRR